MKYPLVLLGCSAALVAFVQPVNAKTSAEIEQIAKAVSVEIQVIGGDAKGRSTPLRDRVGSGVIVHRQGDLYTLVTNRHVACGSLRCTLNKESFSLVTVDGQRHRVGVAGVKLVQGDLDLAIIQFRSNRNYAVAQLAEPGSLQVGNAVYTAGFPRGQGWLFGQGEAQAVVNKRLVGDRGGYTVVYNAETLPGMSGGGAFNGEGRLVAIHGQGDKYRENTQADSIYVKNEVGSKIGYNRGIPIRWMIQGLGEEGIVVGSRRLPRAAQEGAAATADEFFIAGFNKVVDPGEDVRKGREDAVQQFSQAIAINPKYTIAYFMRAYVKDALNDSQGVLADYNQVIALSPKNAVAYNNRGNLKATKLNDPQGALADYNQVIALNPKFAEAYINRGFLKADKLNDPQGALADYNQAIALDPKLAEAYNKRGALKQEKLNDSQGALADYNQAIILNPEFAFAYNNRGIVKQNNLNDLQGALADFNQAIALDPKYAVAYSNRGFLKADKLNDLQGALADFNQAIALDPKYAVAYSNRGFLKADKLNDLQGALADFNQAIALDPKFAGAYNNRGLLKATKFNDPQGALADFNQSISLNAKYAEAYNNRGFLKQDKLNDPQGALADYNQAIALNSNHALAYTNRGVLKYLKLNDRPGGIQDLRTAAQLFRSQGNTAKAEQILDVLRRLGVSE